MLVEVCELRKTFRRGSEEIHALSGVNFSFDRGEFVSVMGPSGSGKSTLLQLLGGIDLPSSGEVRIGGSNIATFNDRALSEFRRQRLGYVFQFFNLLPTLTALENVLLPRLFDGDRLGASKHKAFALLKTLGLEGREKHKPGELSGGQMQRVAIARALISDPVLILADEPTGNLDSKAGDEVLKLFRSLVEETGVSILMVTHDARAASFGHKLIAMKDGLIQEIKKL